MRRFIILKPSSGLCNKVYRCFSIFQYFVYKLHGLSPWTLKVSEMIKKTSRIEDNQNDICKISYIGAFYNILLMLLNASILLYFQYHLGQDKQVVDEIQSNIPAEIPEENFDNRVSDILDDIASWTKTISVYWSLLFYIYKQKSMIKVINRLSCVDQKLNISVDSYAKKTSSYFFFMINFLSTITRIILDMPIRSSPTLSVYYNFPIVMYSWIIVQYALLLGIVEEQFKALNSSIRTSDFSQISTSMVRLSLTEESAFQEIDNLENLYIELYDICEEINNFYGLLLLISILCLNYYVIGIVAFVIIPIEVPDEIYEFLFYLAQVLFVPWVIVLILVLTSAVSKTIDQSQETGPLIISLSEQCPMNPQVNERLVKFSRDLLLFKVEFSAWDTLPLDRNLLGIVCVTVVTFVVIIVA